MRALDMRVATTRQVSWQLAHDTIPPRSRTRGRRCRRRPLAACCPVRRCTCTSASAASAIHWAPVWPSTPTHTREATRRRSGRTFAHARARVVDGRFPLVRGTRAQPRRAARHRARIARVRAGQDAPTAGASARGQRAWRRAELATKPCRAAARAALRRRRRKHSRSSPTH